ncbi:MAG: ArsR family transcriptional regulator, arsenate/arsenite/antimonite-responsive transcriptional [Acidimicrobiaceae bacterium]|nr:ArsR family transcriptional regulator, arsenate/arsenite/antimonite-responsive transcriptional [Acidimicrobiaceae bacterium]
MAKVTATIPVRIEDECCASVLTAPLADAQAAELARGFAALADPARLQILSILAGAPAGEVCVCEFVEPLGKSQPTVSHHLKVLSDAHLVVGDRRGKWVWYRIVPDRLEALRAALAPRQLLRPDGTS